MNKTNRFSKPRLYNRIGLVGLLSLISVCPPSARAVDAKIGIKEASALYANKKYVESADAFETLLKTATPNGKLYYYAVLANFYANRKGRARQLSQYVAKVFPGTVEAGYCQKLFPELAGSSPATGGGTAELLKAKQGTQLKTLPPEFLATLPQEVQDGLKTGKMVAVKGEGNTLMVTSRENVADQSTASKINQITGGFSGTSFRGSAPRTKEGSRTVAMAGPGIAMTGVRGGRPFTAADVARDGAGGIDQSRNPNCWFEASMAALAELPRGQRLMADMIRYGDNGSFIVRFPRDGVEYTITKDELSRNVHNKALWASIIECAQLKKFPGNAGAEGEDNDQSRLAVGLGCITGCKAEVINPGSSTPNDLSRFIGSAVSSKNPIVCGTWHDGGMGGLPELVISSHAYTIIGFDPSSTLITIRNPHGAGSQRFSLASDPSHREFQQLDDGVFKMSIALFQKYFHSVCRSFI